MRHADRLAREDAITDALRATDTAIGDEPPTPQALRIIGALKRLRADKPVRVVATAPVDYLSRVQEIARATWLKVHGENATTNFTGSMTATAGLETPIGRLKMITWRVKWLLNGGGEKIAWAGEYYLDDEPITVDEIRAAGLARRPTTRNRKRRA